MRWPNRELNRICGIYYLWDGARVLYIGQSRHIAQCISYWRSTRLDFCGYFIDECDASELDARERQAIREFKPLLNEIG